MVGIKPISSINTLNINGLDALFIGKKLLDCIKEQDPTITCLQKTLFRYKNTNKLEVKRWKNRPHTQ